jgi:hypothetical protein
MGTDYGDKQVIEMCTSNPHEKIDKEYLFEVFTLADFDAEKTIRFLQRRNGVCQSDEPVNTWKNVREVYLSSNVYNPKDIDIMMKEPDIPELIRFLCVDSNISAETVEKTIDHITKSYMIFRQVYRQRRTSNEFKSFRSYQHKHYSQLENKVSKGLIPKTCRSSHFNFSPGKKNNCKAVL